MSSTTEITRREASSLRSEIKRVVGDRQKNSMELCRLIHEASFAMVSVGNEPSYVWQLWGYESWEDCMGHEFKLFPTTAYRYRRIWQVFFVDLTGCWDHSNQLAITKMGILSSDEGLTKRNVNARLKRAKTKTCRQLAAEVYGVEELHHFSASVSKNEMRLLKRVIKAARQDFGEEGENMPRGEVLARILREWNTIRDRLKRTPAGKLKLAS